MRTEDSIIRLFCKGDDHLPAVKKRPDASLYRGEVVTSGMVSVVKGVWFRAFYRWLKGDDALVSHVAERTRPLRLPARCADVATE